jgi:hypothetical protein
LRRFPKKSGKSQGIAHQRMEQAAAGAPPVTPRISDYRIAVRLHKAPSMGMAPPRHEPAAGPAPSIHDPGKFFPFRWGTPYVRYLISRLVR